jgi:hypothetical protein
MWPVPRAAYGLPVFEPTVETRIAPTRVPTRNPMRVYCARCHHTEFVHCDTPDRSCLYSECQCGGFVLLISA